jgi:hypothetical protein
MGENIPKVEVSYSDFQSLNSGINPTSLNEIIQNINTEAKYYHITRESVEYAIVVDKDGKKLELRNT